MEFEKIHNKGQAQLFKNQLPGNLTKTHPLVIWGMYFPVMIYMLYYSSASLGFTAGKNLFLLFSAVCFRTFFEYISHRFLFHLMAESERAKKFIIHPSWQSS